MALDKNTLINELEKLFKDMYKKDSDDFSGLASGFADAIHNYYSQAEVSDKIVFTLSAPAPLPAKSTAKGKIQLP
jgi:hypothetical protein